MKLTKCPYCLNNWQNSFIDYNIWDLECDNCNVGYIMSETLYLFRFPESYYNLIFNFNLNNCTLECVNPWSEITLPLLPIDISAKQLKKLITFL